jgi:thioredoxin 1
MAAFAKEVMDTEFETAVLGSDQPVLVDFWAEWCGPCRMIAPSVEAVAEEYDGKASFFKMDVDNNQNVPQRYGIRGIPTLILFKGGQEQERIVGAVSREAIAKVVGKYVSNRFQESKRLPEGGFSIAVKPVRFEGRNVQFAHYAFRSRA